MKGCVFDLDGTLVGCNTFPRWVFFLLFKSFASFNFFLFLKLLILVFRRKLLFSISHYQFKYKINQLANNVPEDWPLIFSRFIKKKYIRKSVLENIKLDEFFVVVSTAAPACYAYCLAKELIPSVDLVLCSFGNDQEFDDNFGFNKILNLKSKINRIDFKTGWVFFTDHYDDIPMAREIPKVFLCSPSSSTISKFIENNIDFEVIDDAGS